MTVKAKASGSLIIIGGGEDKETSKDILKEVATRAKRRKGPLVIITAATNYPEVVARDYCHVFTELGVHDIKVVDIRTREDAYDERNVELMLKASLLFFTGGDQLRITSQVGDSPTYRCMDEMYRKGLTVAGTSAGAAAMSETMVISGPSEASFEAYTLGMAPGLGLIRDVVIDTHFAERGRMGRLLGGVSQNPRNLGIGIDEDTAIIVEREESFKVIGSGAVYVLDGTTLSYSSLSEKYRHGILCTYDMKLHVLGAGCSYNLLDRQPIVPQELEKAAASSR